MNDKFVNKLIFGDRKPVRELAPKGMPGGIAQSPLQVV
jgi:hypothetical protein